jgi:hypothetical protein
MLLLAGCATADTIYNQFGEEVVLVECGGTTQTACFDKAKEFCDGAYTVIEKGNNPYNGAINALIVKCGTEDIETQKALF